MEGLLILAAIVGGVAGIVAVANKSSAVNALRPLAKFESGKYLGGLPGQLIPTPKTTTVISTDAITFLSEWGQTLGTVPQTRVISYAVEDKTQALQRLTATRIATLGVFALAAPKTRKNEEFLIHLSWLDDDRQEQHAVFEIAGMGARIHANLANELIRKHVRPARSEQPAPVAERKCPYCAETIKAEAIICKHCRSQLSAQ